MENDTYLKSLIPFLNSALVVSSVRFQELQILLLQLILACEAAHVGCEILFAVAVGNKEVR